jgi:mannosyl-3-phosphoglycerate phosphatase
VTGGNSTFHVVLIVFTDLDGTLLDSTTYSFDLAVPALRELKHQLASVILVSSKTLQEVEFWRNQVDSRSPFAVENGAAVFANRGNPALPTDVARQYGEYDMVEFGVPYLSLTRALKSAARETACRVRGFAGMKVQEISRLCNLSLEQATLAKRRQYGEPFLIVEGDVAEFQSAVQRRGLRMTRGGRFFHIMGQHDKADAVQLLIDAYRRMGPVRTVGIGDGLNDAGFLNIVDYPILLESSALDEVRRHVPRARIAPAGPVGWNESVLEILEA